MKLKKDEHLIPAYYNEFFFQTDEAYKELFIDYVFELGVEAIEERNQGVFIRSNEDLKQLVWAVNLFKEQLCKKEQKDINFNFTVKKKRNKDWIEEYKKNISALQIDNFYIHSSWQKPKEKLINIQIDPALAFGSGHHESTHSCIKFLQQYAKTGMKVLDLGCGSGILAIILAKLSCEVYACDTDEIAVKSSLNNAKLNGVKFQELWQGTLRNDGKKYELIVANLVSEIILSLEKGLKNHLDKNAFLILSGILDKDLKRIQDAFEDLKLISSLKNNEWLSLVYQKEK